VQDEPIHRGRRLLRRAAGILGFAGLLAAAMLLSPVAAADSPPTPEKAHTNRGKLRTVPDERPKPAVDPQHEPKNLKGQASSKDEDKGTRLTDPIDVKVLVISANGQELYDFDALKAQLDRVGVPYDVLVAAQHTLNGAPYTSLASVLSDGAAPDQGGRGHYQAIMLTTGNLTYSPDGGVSWISAFTAAEWDVLARYEAAFGIRQVTNYTYPSGAPSNYCLSLAPRVYVDTTMSALATNLTPAGASTFGYLNAASPVTIRYSWTYLAYPDPSNAASGNVLTPLLTAPDDTGGQYVIASTCRFSDGRENLAVTAANNPDFLHSELLAYGIINWVTKGRFLGERHVSMNYQPDDLFIEDDVWNPANSPDGLSYDPGADCIPTTTLSCPSVRMSGNDITALVNWQTQLRSSTTTPNFRLEFPFNGEGTDPTSLSPSCRTGQGQPCLPDTLTPAVRASQQNFNFINHTYSHLNLDQNCVSYNTSTTPATCTQWQPVTYAQVTTELQRNHQLRNDLGLTNYFKDALVQPDISGLTNPTTMQAARDFGIRYMISDASRPGWNNPSPNAGIYSPLQSQILVIPRRANNLFFNIYNPADWLAEYNCFYYKLNSIKCGGSSFEQFRYLDQPITYEGILEHESDQLLQYLLKWDIDPIMFHQPNVVEYAPGRTVLGDLVKRLLDKYNSVYTLPIRNMRQHQVGLTMADRMRFNAAKSAGLSAAIVPCGAASAAPTITLTSPVATVVPVTGVRFGNTVETYGGQNISYVDIKAGQTVLVPLTCP
jgi:hypothetical protein